MKKVEYSEDLKTAYFDGHKFRLDVKTGYYLASRPTYQGKRERLHCYVWRYFNGFAPARYHVHHADGDKSHNDIENLRCIPESLHTRHHGVEWAANNYEAIVENLKSKAMPKAAEWHRSEAGRAWHREHYMESVGKAKPILHKCLACGKEYFSKQKSHSKFCSNKCKSAYRRKIGVDDETRKCAICGKQFTTNRYSRKMCCSKECAVVLRWNNIHSQCGKTAGL